MPRASDFFKILIADTVSLQPVAQRQEMVSGTLALLTGLLRAAICVSRASAPKGDVVL